jgi:hypothetical protein
MDMSKQQGAMRHVHRVTQSEELSEKLMVLNLVFKFVGNVLQSEDQRQPRGLVEQFGKYVVRSTVAYFCSKHGQTQTLKELRNEI